MDHHSLSNFLYHLPDDRIATHPLQNRDQSKLMFYDRGQISHYTFEKAKDLIPEKSLIFLNNTKVICARLIFFKATGARIEIFLTEPVEPHSDFQKAFEAKERCSWKCLVGNAKKWKDSQSLCMEFIYLDQKISLNAQLKDRNTGLVEFSWNGSISFSEIVDIAGNVPLPPYLNREAEIEDKQRYQTVFSELEGAVAAPTAGLHFTKDTLSQIEELGHTLDYLTLHVSAGTFRPIKEENFTSHPMHNEQIIIYKQNIENLLNATGLVIPVGTTAMRTLESLYWYGCKLFSDPSTAFKINKSDPYQRKGKMPSKEQAFKSILSKMESEKINELQGETEIFIYPGYQFKVCSGLFTNFHMPGSTLILLVASFIGDDWRKVYNSALENEYRFLSYGDTSLLLP